MVYSILLSALIAYLLGSISTSIIVSKLFGVNDIREKGSGNAGATNTLRVVGAKAAVLVVVGDALKGIIAVCIAGYLSSKVFLVDNDLYSEFVAAVMVVVGHVFPIYFSFKGGKGIMTSIAVIMVLDWRIGLILVGVFVLLILMFNYVSLASCVCAFIYPIIVYIINGNNIPFIVSAVIIAVIAIAKHRTNIVRLINGTESKLFKKSTVKR